MVERLQQLSSREQVFLLGGAVVVFILILYWVILDPFFTRTNQLKDELNNKRNDLEQLQQVANHIQQFKQKNIASFSPTAKESFLVTVSNTLQEINLNNFVTQINQTSSNEIHVHFNEVPFDSLISWLTKLWQKYRIKTNTFTLIPVNKEGIVAVDLTLKLAS